MADVEKGSFSYSKTQRVFDPMVEEEEMEVVGRGNIDYVFNNSSSSGVTQLVQNN